MKGRPTMKNSAELSTHPLPNLRPLAADRAYQGLTIAAMIALLVTLWAF
jgi:hypothetical protein